MAILACTKNVYGKQTRDSQIFLTISTGQFVELCSVYDVTSRDIPRCVSIRVPAEGGGLIIMIIIIMPTYTYFTVPQRVEG